MRVTVFRIGIYILLSSLFSLNNILVSFGGINVGRGPSTVCVPVWKKKIHFLKYEYYYHSSQSLLGIKYMSASILIWVKQRTSQMNFEKILK